MGAVLDIESLRRHFPALAEGAAHFDGPGGSQVPEQVGAAVAATLTAAIANRGRITAAERRADDIVGEARRAMGDLLGTDPSGVVWGRSMTQLTYDMARALAASWDRGDEVVVTRLDHDANVRPWLQAAERVGAVVRWIDFDPSTGEMTLDHAREALGDRTRLVAVTGASNLIGTRPPVAEICRLAHDVGALTYIDGVHLTPHEFVDIDALGADFFACSPYKFMGPHCGVVASRPSLLEQLHPDKLLPSLDTVPERFELGTLPYELMAGVTAAINFLAGLSGEATGTRRDRLGASMTALAAHERTLCSDLERRLQAISGVTLYGRAARRTPTLLFSLDAIASPVLSGHLAAAGVNAPAGSFYAIEASRRLGLGDRGAVRAGIAPYNHQGDVDRLVAGVESAARGR